MLKKSLSIVILISMVLHCSSRLGFLSYLYEKRHTIAYSAGLIAEIPIAICKSDYSFKKSFKIHHDDSEQNIPPGLVATFEINLFFQPSCLSLVTAKRKSKMLCSYSYAYS
jgi:hypothetical protein